MEEDIPKLKPSYFSLNKERVKLQKQQYYLDNKDKIYNKQKLYRKENYEILKSQRNKYREENKDKINKTQLIYDKNRRINEPLYKFKKNYSSIMRNSFSKNGYTKKIKDL